MTQAKNAQGTLLQRGDGATPEVFTTIAEINNIEGPELEAEEIEVTNHDSPDGYKEFIPGLKDGGSISIEGNFVATDDTHQQLIADFESGEVNNYRILLPDSTVEASKSRWTFAAMVKSLSTKYPTSGSVTFSAALRISGKPELSSSEGPNLTALVVTTATLSPAFAATAYSYGSSVANAVTSVTVTPTCAAASSIKVNGTVVASGSASGAIALSVGVNNITVTTYGSNNDIKTYTITIVRAAS